MARSHTLGRRDLTFTKRENADKIANEMRGRAKDRTIEVREGTHSYGGGVGVNPKKQKVYRVWFET